MQTPVLPYRSQILRDGNFDFDGVKFSAAEVVARLEPHVTAARIARISEVIDNRTYRVAVVAEGLYDIGNISAVMRSAESFGFMPFHILERENARYKMSDRISRGSEKWLDIHKENSVSSCLMNLKRDGHRIFATDLNATHAIEDIDFAKPTAVVFGNEKEGISDELRALSDGTFRLPMWGFAQSFNISVAAALCFAHIHRVRREKMGQSGDLTDEEKLVLRAHYYLRTLDGASAILRRVR